MTTEATETTKHGCPITPPSEMTYANARQIALDFVPNPGSTRTYDHWLDGQGSIYTPGGPRVSLGGYVWFHRDLSRDNDPDRTPARKLKHDEVAVWWGHDPERRVYVFRARELWQEAHSGVSQAVMEL